ncbi:MAG: glycosyl transferase [Robiginitomaculum sp.]|nr:MAG: glycosyl transferase [Robiginitomaculum sp.]
MPRNADTDSHKKVLYLLIGLGALRIIGLLLSPANLHGDEAQYWAWSQSFEFGYFSKPPMIAWVIAATTSLFGNAEWAVRLSSPLIHPLTAYLIYRTGRFVFDERTGFWAACLYFLMPAVWLSSAIVSTDVVLLFWWALGLNAWAHLRETPNLKWAALLGLAIGFGMLSKYAMLFFLIALALCAVFDTKTRKALLSRRGITAGLIALIALIIVAPNLYWNATNDFATLNHTAANANLKGVPFHPLKLIEFWGSQIFVFGPLTLGLLVMALYVNLRKPTNKTVGDKTVLALSLFVLCPLLVISAEALLSRANANWAVTAYIGGAILCAHYGLKMFERLTKTGIWVNVGMGVIFTIAGLLPLVADNIGATNAFKRVRGWPETTARVQVIAKAGHEGQAFQAIATDNRLVFYDLLYYGIEQETGLPLRMWLNTAHPAHHAEKTAPLYPTQDTDAPILIVNYFKECQDVPSSQTDLCLERLHASGKLAYIEKLRADFTRLEKLPALEIDLGGGKFRRLNLWAGYGYTPTQQPSR